MRCGLLTFGLVVALLLPARSADAASITFKSQDVPLTSNAFTVDILVDGLDQTVLGFLFNFAFDPAVLALQAVAEGGFLSQSGQTEFFTDSFSSDFYTVSSYLTTGSTASAAGVLATLTFVSRSAGPSGLTLLSVMNESLDLRSGFTTFKAGIPEENIPDEYGFLEAGLMPGAINVVAPPPQPVPEPSTLGLLGIGLAALARKRLRRKSETSA